MRLDEDFLKKNINFATTSKREKYLIISFLLSLCFYLGFALIDGPVICKDSESYISMNISREPLYPLFLAILRGLFGENTAFYDQPVYLCVAVIIQSLLWAAASFILGKTVYDEASKKELPQIFGKFSAPILFGFAGVFAGFFVALLNRFAALRGSMYSECIMTESLAMPLFILLCIRLYKWTLYHERNDLIISMVYAFLIVSIRKQMMSTLILVAALSILNDLIRRSRNIKRFLVTIGLCTSVLLASSLFDHVYNYALRGAWMSHTGNTTAEFCTLIFSADESDDKLFDEYGTTEMKELFDQIISESDSQGLLLENVEEGADIFTIGSAYADSYDVIGYDVAPPVIYNYIANTYGDVGEIQREVYRDEIQAEISKVLLHQDISDLILVYGINILKGLISSNARVMPIINEISILIYICFLGMYAYFVKKKKTQITVLAEVSFGGILINSLVVGALIFPQPRYMIYSMSLFYICFFIMLICILQQKFTRKS